MCYSLREIKLPDSIKIISDSFFQCTSLKSINIPENTEKIAGNAFISCSSLNKIRLPEKLHTIGNWAFHDCHNLQYITILNPACDIFDSEDTIPEQTKIYGYAGSTAESYAAKYNRTFIPIEEGKFAPFEVQAKEATEEKHGNIKYYECAVTGKLFSDKECTKEITIEDTIAHNTENIIPGKAATCTESGLTEGRSCSLCGEISVSQEVIPTVDHTVTQWTVVVPATCTENGSEKGVCSVCGAEVTRIIEAGHKDSDKDGKCDACGESMEEKNVEIWFPFKEYIVAFFEKVLEFFINLFANMGIEC